MPLSWSHPSGRVIVMIIAITAGVVRASCDDQTSLDALTRQVESQNAWITELDQMLRDQQSLIDRLSTAAEDSADAVTDTDDPTLETRVGRLEDVLQTTQQLPGDFLESLSTYAQRNVNGRVHIDQWAFPDSSPGVNIIENGNPLSDPENRLLYRRIRFGVNGMVPPFNMSYRVEIEFSGQDGSQFRDAWIGWDGLTLLNTVRIGNQKRPYGWAHLNSSNFMVFLERPFIVEAFNQDSRRFGVVSYGASDDERWNWQFGAFNLTEVQSSGAIISDHMQREVAGRLGSTWWYDESSDGRGYAHWGLAGTVAFPDGEAPNTGSDFNDAIFQTRPEGRSTNQWLDTGRIAGARVYEILGLESVFNVGSLQFAGEFMHLWLQRSHGNDDHLRFYGAYGYVSYFLTGEHIPWNRRLGILGRVDPHEDFFLVRSCDGRYSRGWGAWQVAARLSYADLNSSDVLGGVGQSLTLAVNWYWNSHSRMQFNYLIGRIDDRQAELSTGGMPVVSGDYQIAGVRFMIDF